MKKTGKKLDKKNIGLILLFLVGLSILLYPTASSTWNTYRSKRLISDYTASVSKNSGDGEYTAMLEAARAYNEKLVQEAVPDAFSVRAGIQDEEYEALLHMNEEGMMGALEIPAIGENLPVFHYTTDEALQKGVGHLFGSSLPVGGEGTHAVLSAHRGLPAAKLFTDLPLLKEGDVFYLHILDDILAYEVDQILTVEPKEVGELAITEGKDYVTLVTCTPYGVNSHRVLVRGHRVPFAEEEYAAQHKSAVRKDVPRLLVQVLFGAAGILIAGVLVWLISRFGGKHAKKKP